MELKIRIAIGKALDANPEWRKSLQKVETQQLLADAAKVGVAFISTHIDYIGRL